MSSIVPPEHWIMVLGKTGSGKSTFLNMFLGKKVFGVGDFIFSCTEGVQFIKVVIGGVRYVLVDTEGFQGTDGKEYEIFKVLSKHQDIKKINTCLYFMSDTRWTADSDSDFNAYLEYLGSGVLKNTFFVKTNFANFQNKGVVETSAGMISSKITSLTGASNRFPTSRILHIDMDETNSEKMKESKMVMDTALKLNVTFPDYHLPQGVEADRRYRQIFTKYTARGKREEEERIRAQQAAEAERLRREREAAEQARIAAQKKAQKLKEDQEREKKRIADENARLQAQIAEKNRQLQAARRLAEKKRKERHDRPHIGGGSTRIDLPRCIVQ